MVLLLSNSCSRLGRGEKFSLLLCKLWGETRRSLLLCKGRNVMVYKGYKLNEAGSESGVICLWV